LRFIVKIIPIKDAAPTLKTCGLFSTIWARILDDGIQMVKRQSVMIIIVSKLIPILARKKKAIRTASAYALALNKP